MKKIIYALVILLSFPLFLNAQSWTADNGNAQSSEKGLVINMNEKGAEIAPSMYGIFFEEINHAGDGGLYAELIQNRSFEELEMPEGYHAEGNKLFPKPVCEHGTNNVRKQTFKWNTSPVPAWRLQSESDVASMKLTKENPKFTTAPNNLEVSINNSSFPVLLINEGYWGIGVKKNETYNLRVIFKPSSDYKGNLTAKILGTDGTVLASTPIKIGKKNQWNDVRVAIKSQGTDAKAEFAIEMNGNGKVNYDYVSLFPEHTFNKRANGLRKDVAGMLAGLKPAFVRWPGGCVVEGISLENRFEWKKTLGDPASRPGEYSTWGYRCSYGFGYYEMLQFCEDINADAMYVCNVGMGCQYRMADASDSEKIDYYLDDCMDAIEYALGDASTEWGRNRIKDGHKSPFPLKYVEIGNENWGDEYDKRFDIFYAAIKKKYPELILISNHGLGGIGKSKRTDMVDPHYYVNPEFFFQNTKIFDEQPRGKYDAYVGEYACNSNVGGGNLKAALSEAAFISGMERNGDFVKMASYAPLLENRNDRAWAVNLIWLDTDQVVGRSSYYVQQMAAENRPSYNIKSNMTMAPPRPMNYNEGKIGFGSWSTNVEFKDIKITNHDGTIINADLNRCSDKRGEWKLENGSLLQTSSETPSKYVIDDFSGNKFTMECKARKLGGKEGFLIYLGLSSNNQDGFLYNIGGWNNQSTGVEKVAAGKNAGGVGKTVGQHIEQDKWYDIKLIVTTDKSELYVDNELILTHSPESTPLQFISSGYDEVTKEVIVKVVNAEDKAYSTRIDLEGGEVEAVGKIISLSSNSDKDENSFENPKKIYPEEIIYNSFGNSFNYSFPPFSYTVLRIKRK